MHICMYPYPTLLAALCAPPKEINGLVTYDRQPKLPQPLGSSKKGKEPAAKDLCVNVVGMILLSVLLLLLLGFWCVLLRALADFASI